METGYQYLGIDTAIQVLRPGAKFQLVGVNITNWEHPSPPPTNEEIQEVMRAIKELEDSNRMKAV